MSDSQTVLDALLDRVDFHSALGESYDAHIFTQALAVLGIDPLWKIKTLRVTGRRSMRAKAWAGDQRLYACCPVVWRAVKVCNAWGSPSDHGCKLHPNHDGAHVCACGSRR